MRCLGTGGGGSESSEQLESAAPWPAQNTLARSERRQERRLARCINPPSAHGGGLLVLELQATVKRRFSKISQLPTDWDLVGVFNQEKALVGAFSVITNLHVDLRLKLYLVPGPPPVSPLLILSGGLGFCRGSSSPSPSPSPRMSLATLYPCR